MSICAVCGFPRFASNQAISYSGPICVCEWRNRNQPTIYPTNQNVADLSERVKTLETALRCLLKGDKEAAKSLMEMSE